MLTTHRDGTVQAWDLALLRDRSPSFYTLKDLHDSARVFAAWLTRQGDVAAAQRTLEESLRLGEAAVRRFPAHYGVRASMVTTHQNLAWLAANTGQPDLARHQVDVMLRGMSSLAEEVPTSPALQAALAQAYQVAGDVDLKLLGYAAAEAHYDTALEVYQRLKSFPRTMNERSNQDAIDRLERKRRVSRLAGRATADLTFALSQNVELIPELLVQRFNGLAAQGQHAALAETAERLAERYPEESDILYDAACGYGLAVKALDAGRTPDRLTPAEQSQRARYAARAMELLRRALRFGFDDLAQLQQDRDLEAIRSDKRFSQLPAEIGKPVDETSSQEPKSLRYRFRPGETLKYTAEIKIRVDGSIRGKHLVSEAPMSMDLHWQVKSVAPDGSARITLHMERLRMTIPNPKGKELVFDSRDGKPTDGDPNKLFLWSLYRFAEQIDATVQRTRQDARGEDPGERTGIARRGPA